MSAVTPEPIRDRSNDARMIADLRRHRRDLDPRRTRYTVTDDELDALLDAAADLDALRAAETADPIPRGTRVTATATRIGDVLTISIHDPSATPEILANHFDAAALRAALVETGEESTLADEPVDLPDEPFAPPLATLRATCTRCLEEITTTTDELGRPDVLWAHVDTERMRANHFATPTPGFSVVEPEARPEVIVTPSPVVVRCQTCGADIVSERLSPTGWKHAPREVSFSTPGPIGYDHYAAPRA